MNQEEFISQILQAEHRAESISSFALEQEEDLKKDVAAATAKLNEEYSQRAQKRLESVRKEEEKNTQKQLSLLQARLQKKLDQIQNIYREKKNEWVDSIFARIIDS